MLLISALILLVGIAVLIICRRLTRGSQCDVNRLESFIAGEPISDYYRPLERLLQKRDSEYLSAQPGMTPTRIRAFRAQRRKLFRQYLSNLIGDFGALCFLVKALMVQSTVDRPDLASSLYRAKTDFYSAVLMIQFRLMAHAIGFPAVNIEIGDLTRALDSITAQARMLQLSATPSLG